VACKEFSEWIDSFKMITRNLNYIRILLRNIIKQMTERNIRKKKLDLQKSMRRKNVDIYISKKYWIKNDHVSLEKISR